MQDLYVLGISINFIITFLVILYLIIKNSTLDTTNINNINILIIGTIGFIVSSFLGTFIFCIGMITVIVSSISSLLKGDSHKVKS